MSFHNTLKKSTLAAVLAATTAMAQTPYDEGQKALRDQEWLEAADQFEQAFESEQADAAMYWRAHALYKAQRKGDAIRQVQDLERKYPDSKWVKEAQTLQIEHQGSARRNGMDDELRLYALHQLMERDPERALPLVMDIMRETDSPSVRRDALFVLGMSESPEALEVIAEIARESDDPRFQAEAINILGVAGSAASLELLASLYTPDADRKVREAVIHAHIIGEDPKPLVEFLRTESDPRLQRDIIHALGIMEATEELHEIYPRLTDRRAKVAAIEAFSIAGDSAQLHKVLETEDDERLRRAAIEGIAISDDEGAAEYLKSVYDQSASKQEKTMVLEALYILDDAEDVAVKILEDESDPGLRRQAIEVLAMNGDERVAAYLTDRLSEGLTGGEADADRVNDDHG